MYDQNENFEDMKIEDYIKDSEILQAQEYVLQKRMDDALMYTEEEMFESIVSNLQGGIDEDDGLEYTLNYLFQKCLASWGYHKEHN